METGTPVMSKVRSSAIPSTSPHPRIAATPRRSTNSWGAEAPATDRFRPHAALVTTTRTAAVPPTSCGTNTGLGACAGPPGISHDCRSRVSPGSTSPHPKIAATPRLRQSTNSWGAEAPATDRFRPHAALVTTREQQQCLPLAAEPNPVSANAPAPQAHPKR